MNKHLAIANAIMQIFIGILATIVFILKISTGAPYGPSSSLPLA